MFESKLLWGMIVSLLGGWLAVWLLERWLRLYTGEKSELQQRARVPGWITGFIERGVFTLFIAYEVLFVGALIVAWLGSKLASNWNRPAGNTDESWIAFAFAALNLGLVSIAFAVIGGRIACSKPLWW